jgi:cytochrome c biogenesis protein CcdA
VWHFVLGLSLVFAVMGASASLVGNMLLMQRVPLMQLGGALIVVFGLQTMGVLRLGWLARTYLPLDAKRVSTVGGPAVHGSAHVDQHLGDPHLRPWVGLLKGVKT